MAVDKRSIQENIYFISPWKHVHSHWKHRREALLMTAHKKYIFCLRNKKSVSTFWLKKKHTLSIALCYYIIIEVFLLMGYRSVSELIANQSLLINGYRSVNELVANRDNSLCFTWIMSWQNQSSGILHCSFFVGLVVACCRAFMFCLV